MLLGDHLIPGKRALDPLIRVSVMLFSVKQRYTNIRQQRDCFFVICTGHLLLWSLTALVQCVEPSNVIPTHFLSITKGNIGIGDRDHGGLAILGESSSTIAITGLNATIRFQTCTHIVKCESDTFLPVVLHDRVVIIRSALIESSYLPEIVFHS